MQAMVLSAGFGKRMRPLTDTKPKPLLVLRGKPMLDHVIDKLAAAGHKDVVVNTHYLGRQIIDHLAPRTDVSIRFSREETLLETGGGIRHALPLLGEGPWMVCNADMFWLDGAVPLMRQLRQAWHAQRMDVLLTVFAREKGFGYHGRGDFHLQADGRLRRRGTEPGADYVFTGVQILRGPELFHGLPDGPFSLNRIYDRALSRGRLYGHAHRDGRWFHIGTPQALAGAEQELEALT